MKNKYITLGTGTAFTVNFLLFAVKLYIGLSINSVSIYSDAVNNLFDSLSGLLGFICFSLLLKSVNLSSVTLIKRSEELLSFIVSIAVGGAGFSFAYSSLERLMYPTPVWYQKRYLYILCATAAVKIVLYFIFLRLYKKCLSPLIKAIALDSVLDFFITSFTIVGLILSSRGTYSIDAFCGIGISVVLIISAVKMIVSSTKALLCYVPKDKRDELEEGLYELYGKENISSISFLGGDTPKAIVELSSHTESDEQKLKKIENETGITINVTKGI